MTALEQGGRDDDEEILAGQWYAECFRVGQNAFEFKVDCGQQQPDSNGASNTMYLRILTNPIHARELFQLLGVALLHYADRFGPPVGPESRPGERLT